MIMAGDLVHLLPLLLPCQPFPERRRGILIIQKAPCQIKRLVHDVEGFTDYSDIQCAIRRVYSDSCNALINQLPSDGKSILFSFPNIPGLQRASIIQSSNQRRFILGEDYEVHLQLYQIRSKDRRHYEDILVEPLYPSYMVSLYEVYRILLEKTECRPTYSRASLLSSRNRHDIRKRFSERWVQITDNQPLPLESFDLFYQSIHNLTSDQLFILFGTRITYV